MPKIKQTIGHDDSLNVQNSNNVNNEVTNNRENNYSQYNGSSLPTSQFPYNNEYSKSPLATFEMSKNKAIESKTHWLTPSYKNVHADYLPNSAYDQQLIYDCKKNWKKILLWILGILALIALMIGLYFLISTLLNRSKNQTSSSSNSYSGTGSTTGSVKGSAGVNPILINPIPYNNIDSLPQSPYSDNPTTYVTTNANAVPYQNTRPQIEEQLNSQKMWKKANSISYQSITEPLDAYANNWS